MNRCIHAQAVKLGTFTVKGIKNALIASRLTQDDVNWILALSVDRYNAEFTLQGLVDSGDITATERDAAQDLIDNHTEDLDNYMAEYSMAII